MLEGGLSGPVAHLGHALLVGGEFGVELGEFDVDAFDVGVGVGDGGVEGGFGAGGFGAEEAVHGGGLFFFQ